MENNTSKCNCPCHQYSTPQLNCACCSKPEPAPWRERFEKEFPLSSKDNRQTLKERAKIRAFISQELEAAEKRGREEENMAWTSGRRCVECGGEKSGELTDTCKNCLESA